MVKRYEDDNQESALTGTVVQPELFAVSANEQMSTSSRATWLPDMLRAIENKVDASEVESYILPLLLYKYLSDTFDEVCAIPRVEEDLNNGGIAGHVERAKTEREPNSFPREFRWEAICNYPPDGTLGQFLTAAMRGVAYLNPFLRGVVDIKDYDEYRGGQRILDDKHLKRLIDVLSLRTMDRANGGLDTLNIAYEYFLRYSLETARNKAGAFYTPRDVVRLTVKLLEPTAESTIYDPACGAGEFLNGVLHHVEKALSEKGEKLRLYGQERVPTALAMAKMQMFLHSFVKADITAGDALREPHSIEEGRLKRFDFVLTNPPWNQAGYDETFYKRDKWGRFDYGMPPKFSADWGWVQHILASLDDHGRAAVLLDIGAVSRGSGSRSSHKERDIRRALVKLDVIEGAILLPGKLFDKTAAPSLLLLLNRGKPTERKNQILLVDASNYSSQGRTATLRDEDIDAVYEVYKEWETRENFSRVVTVEEICACDYDLSPLLLVEKNIEVHHRPLE